MLRGFEPLLDCRPSALCSSAVHHRGSKGDSRTRRQTGGTQPPLSAPDSFRRSCRMTTRSPTTPPLATHDGCLGWAILAIYFRSPPLFVLNTTSASSDLPVSCLSNLFILSLHKDQHSSTSIKTLVSSSHRVKLTTPPPSPCPPAPPVAANAAPCSSSAPAAPTASTSNVPTASKSLHISASLVVWCQTIHQRHTNTPRISRHQRRRAIPDTPGPIYTKTRGTAPHHKSPRRHKHLDTRPRDDLTGQRRHES